MQKILVAFDGSANSISALRFALSLNKPGTEYHACYVVDYANVGRLGVPAGQGAPDLLAREGRAALGAAEDIARERNVELKRHFFQGDRTDRILECAKRVRADAIVIGTRGQRGAVNRLFGSTTRGLFRHAAIPVFAVSPAYAATVTSGPRRILIGLDGSAASAEAAEAAYAIATQWNAEIDFVHVIDPDRTDDSDDAEALGAMILGTASLQAARRGLKTRQHIVKGSVGESIIRFAKKNGSDVIALGTHGRTGFDRLIMGSVAESVSVDSPIPVLIVRHIPSAVASEV